MTDFKPGDRVRVVNDRSVSAYNGETGVVDTVTNDNFWPIRVIFDKPVAARNSVDADIFDPDEIEIITEDETPADGELQALRERLLALATKITDFGGTTGEATVEIARTFENYITGGTK